MSYFLGTYNWKRTRRDIIEIAVPKKTIMIMAVKILGAAAGFRPKAAMLAKPVSAMIMHGPKIANTKIRTIAAWLAILW